MDREQVLEKIRKLEALAESTTSTAEAQSARRTVSRLYVKYKKILGENFSHKKYTQEKPFCKERFLGKFCVYGISKKRCDELINSIYFISGINLDGENEIFWSAEKFRFRYFLFFVKTYIDFHIVFSSTIPKSLDKMIERFLSVSGLSIKIDN